ncbi:MAG: PaaI family thioesterase [Gammaproteobacteria bacterium]|nr:PaaI family thioesterase [Gammaproteobacteria bacterium]
MAKKPAPDVSRIATENFATTLGIELVSATIDHVVVKMPYDQKFGIGRIHGGAISALIDVAATAAFWSTSEVNQNSNGATVGFTVNFLKLAVKSDLWAEATIRRRGGTLCTANVVVTNDRQDEIAIAVVTYKLTHD